MLLRVANCLINLDEGLIDQDLKEGNKTLMRWASVVNQAEES